MSGEQYYKSDGNGVFVPSFGIKNIIDAVWDGNHYELHARSALCGELKRFLKKAVTLEAEVKRLREALEWWKTRMIGAAARSCFISVMAFHSFHDSGSLESGCVFRDLTDDQIGELVEAHSREGDDFSVWENMSYKSKCTNCSTKVLEEQARATLKEKKNGS